MIYISMFALPILFFFLSLSLDVGSYITETQVTQRIADEASLLGTRLLPSTEKAVSAIDLMLANHNVEIVENFSEELNQRQAKIEISSDSVEIAIRSAIPISFTKIFNSIIGQSNTASEVHTISRSLARVSPLDILLAMDVSNYLSPDVINGESWGESSDWPAAKFFETEEINFQASSVDKRLLTQQCFNPIFSKLKKAAIKTYDVLASFQKNAVGLVFFPSAGSSTFTSRKVKPFIPENELGTSGEASFQSYNGQIVANGAYNSDEWCLLAAAKETSHEDYLLPAEEDNSSQLNQLIDPINNRYNPDYSPYLRAKEVIWSKTSDPTNVGALDSLLSKIRTELIGSPSVTARGVLSSHAQKIAVIFLGGDPFDSSAQQFPAENFKTKITNEFQRLKADIFNYGFNVSIYFLHSNLEDESYFSDEEEDIESFLQSFSENEREDHLGSLQVEVFSGENILELNEKLLFTVLASKRNSILSE
ncbi:MAG: hypothetical protein KDD56_04460 [Bdellovibrionales bacterium]|nr:hypothetical protein [Bdellovibrionales bacterium]